MASALARLAMGRSSPLGKLYQRVVPAKWCFKIEVIRRSGTRARRFARTLVHFRKFYRRRLACAKVDDGNSPKASR